MTSQINLGVCVSVCRVALQSHIWPAGRNVQVKWKHIIGGIRYESQSEQ
jgi:hypothetical protein